MTRLLFAALLALAGQGSARSAPVPVVPPEPLPVGATARLGLPLYTGPGGPDLTFSADGKRIFSLDGSLLDLDNKRTVVVWDTETGRLLSSKPIALSGADKLPRGRSVLTRERLIWLASAERRGPRTPEVVVTDLNGKVLNRFDAGGQPSFAPNEGQDGFGSTAVSSDGRHLAFVADQGQTVTLYALDSGKPLLSTKVDPKARPEVSFAQDNATLFLKQNGEPVRRFTVAGKELPALEGSDGEIRRVAVSPSGKWVVTGKTWVQKIVGGNTSVESVKELQVRDGATGKLMGQLDAGGTAPFFAFVGDDLVVATYKLKVLPSGQELTTLARWNLATSKREWEVNVPVCPFAIAPNGKQIVTTIGQHIALYDAGTGRRLSEPNGHRGGVEWIGFSANGKMLDTLGGGEIITWTSSGQQKHRTPMLSRFGRDDNSRLVCWEGATAERMWPTIYSWDREKRTVGWRIDKVTIGEYHVSPDDEHLVRVSSEEQNKTVIVTVFTSANGKKVREWSFDRPANLWDVAKLFCGGGRFVVLANDNTVTARDVLTGREVFRVKCEPNVPASKFRAPAPRFGGAGKFGGSFAAFAVSADGGRLAVIDRDKGDIEIYDTKTGKLLRRHDYKGSTSVRAVLSPDGAYLVFWNRNDFTQKDPTVWDLSDAQKAPRSLTAGTWAATTCVAFAPDGHTLAVGYADGTTLLWDLTAK